MTGYQQDNAGQTPEAGDFVAYNYSGQIATGYIRSTGKGKWNRTFTIHQVCPKEGHISRVRGGAKCVLVLEKGAQKDTSLRPRPGESAEDTLNRVIEAVRE